MKEKGYKLTEQRRFIIEVFNENPGASHCSKYLSVVKSKHEGNKLSTIYRNLELLSTLKSSASCMMKAAPAITSLAEEHTIINIIMQRLREPERWIFAHMKDWMRDS